MARSRQSLRFEMGTQPLSRGVSRGAIPAVDDRDPKAARWHGVPLGGQILVKSDLQARDAGPPDDPLLQRGRRLWVAPPMRRKHPHAVASSRRAVVKRPPPPGKKPDQRFAPRAPAIEI